MDMDGAVEACAGVRMIAIEAEWEREVRKRMMECVVWRMWTGLYMADAGSRAFPCSTAGKQKLVNSGPLTNWDSIPPG